MVRKSQTEFRRQLPPEQHCWRSAVDPVDPDRRRDARGPCASGAGRPCVLGDGTPPGIAAAAVAGRSAFTVASLPVS